MNLAVLNITSTLWWSRIHNKGIIIVNNNIYTLIRNLKRKILLTLIILNRKGLLNWPGMLKVRIVRRLRWRIKALVLRKKGGIITLVMDRRRIVGNDMICFILLIFSYSLRLVWHQCTQYQRSFRCWVIGSISSGNTGPTPKTVIEPAFIWVWPASLTRFELMPKTSIFCFNSSSYFWVYVFTTILAPPLNSQFFRRARAFSSYLASSSIWI